MARYTTILLGLLLLFLTVAYTATAYKVTLTTFVNDVLVCAIGKSLDTAHTTETHCATNTDGTLLIVREQNADNVQDTAIVEP